MPEHVGRKLAAILVSDVVGYSRLAGADEELTLARLRALRSDLIDPIVSVHHGRIVKRTGDGALVEFRSVVDAVRCAIETQTGLVERNAGLPPERRIEFRIGIHLGDVMEEADGDLMGDGVNIAARLETMCEPGGVCLSEDAYRQVRNRLDLAVTDLGDQALKNIADPIRVYALSVGKPAVAKTVAAVPAAAPLPTSPRMRGEEKQRKALRGGGLIAAAAALIVIAAVAAWYFLARPGAKLVANVPAHLSIVVLPFQNLSNDRRQDYFADGITDNLTTDLSRIRNSFVIARNTAFTYKGKNVDAKEIGKQLDVRYVLEGSVQRDGNRVRVNAQLIDAQSGADLWADRFEEDLADLFKLQDDVVARLANALGYELVKAEAAKSAHSTNPDAIDLSMQGWALLNAAGRNKPRYDEARTHFEAALKLDPQDPEAMAGIALIDSRAVVYGWIDKPDPALAAQLALVDKALAINPNYALAYYVRSYALFFARRYADSVQAAQTGVSIDPNSAYSYFALAQAEKQLGRCEQAVSHMKEAFRLSPRDPGSGVWHMELGIAENCVGHREAALAELKQAIDAGFRTYVSYANLAAVAALNGDDAEAKSALGEARRLAPELNSIKWVTEHIPTTPQVLDGLRKAGLPEDAPPKHLSIVVLPFDNLSGDPKQDYFADGITDNLTTDLSRIRNSFVIARNTAFTYKGKNVDAKEMGKQLDVRYVLEGSVARDGNHIRVNAQLIDAESGSHLWADRFEEDLADLFKLQDDVVARLANTLGYELINAEAQKASRSINPDTIDLDMRGQALLLQSPDKDRNIAARGFFEAALKIDPNNDDALAGKARTYEREFGYGWTTATSHADFDAEILPLADRAIALNRTCMEAYLTKVYYLFLSNRAGEALVAANAGLAVNPNFAPLYIARRGAELTLGRLDDAMSDVQRAMLLSPRDQEMPQWHFQLGAVQFARGNLDAAIAEENKSIESGYRGFQPITYLAAAYALTGKMEEAKAKLAEAIRVNPRLTIKWTETHSPNQTRYVEGLRKAGLREDEPPPPPKHLSIVVLPFDNLSGDPKQDYFADGITDNLTTDLSRIRNSFVIARNTAFTYKGKNVDAKEIGKELGIRYVLEGSVQRDGNRVRVNAQLIDAESGSHLWADRFEEDLADLFKLQDQVVARLANALGYELVKAEAERSAHSTNPDAIDLTMRGLALLLPATQTKESNNSARGLFQQALAVDPNEADALAGVANTFLHSYDAGWDSTGVDYDAEVIGVANRAIALNPASDMAYTAKATYLAQTKRPTEALATAEAGLEHSPNNAALYNTRALVEIGLGRYEPCRTDVLQAIRLSPRDPQLGGYHTLLAAAEQLLGNDDNAVADARKGIEEGYRAWYVYAHLAASLAFLGKNSEATSALSEARRINPALTLQWAIAHTANEPRFFEGLRKAGLPEQ